MKIEEKTSIVISSVDEKMEVLKVLERRGYKWAHGQKPTETDRISMGLRSIEIFDGKVLRYSITSPHFANKISAKEFLEKNKCIIIYNNGAETVAFDKDSGKKAVAKCHPDDEYDFYTGAKLALERLTGGADQKEQPKQLYNGKVVCVDNKKNENVYTVGKIYQFKDGNFLDDNGRLMPDNDTIHTFRDWQEWTASKFIEVVE